VPGTKEGGVGSRPVCRRLEARKEFITCQSCAEKVPFVEFIKRPLKSDPVASKMLAMDESNSLKEWAT
jgi:hypothetical protein